MKRSDLELSWKELFEQAAGDLNDFSRASAAWSDSPDDLLLTEILSSRGRSRLAFNIMGSDLPPEYQHHKERLDRLWDKSEDLLNQQLIADNKTEQIINRELVLHIDKLNHMLREVRRIAQDADLLDDRELASENLREIAHEFLSSFHKTALASEELKREPFKKKINSQYFQEKFSATDQLFQRYFGYFYDVRDLFPILRRREYGVNCWWLERLPEFDDVQEDEIPEEVMSAFISAFQNEKSEECPFSEKTVEYALGELDSEEERQKVETHLAGCPPCEKLASAVYRAEIEAEEKNSRFPDRHETTRWDAVEKKMRNFISQHFSFFLTPKIMSAVAAACFIFIFTLYRLYERPAISPQWPLSVNISLIGNPAGPFTRIRGETSAPEEFELKEGGVLKTGDSFKIKIKTDNDAYIYVIFHDSLGEVFGLSFGKKAANKTHLLSDGSYGFELDDNTGVETIYLIASKDAMKDFDKKTEELRKVGVDEIKRLFPKASVRSFSFRHE